MFKKMMTPLSDQELHNLAMNIVGKKLQKMGYEFVAVNSKLKKHPQFVLFKKGRTYNVLYWLRLLIISKILK